jgi:hypothetical protein
LFTALCRKTLVALNPPQGAAQQQQHTEGAGDELTPIETLHDVFPVRMTVF